MTLDADTNRNFMNWKSKRNSIAIDNKQKSNNN